MHACCKYWHQLCNQVFLDKPQVGSAFVLLKSIDKGHIQASWSQTQAFGKKNPNKTMVLVALASGEGGGAIPTASNSATPRSARMPSQAQSATSGSSVASHSAWTPGKWRTCTISQTKSFEKLQEAMNRFDASVVSQVIAHTRCTSMKGWASMNI
jgi:hypothetical protein